MTSPSDMTPAPNIDGLIKRLRSTRANMLGTDDERHYWACHEAADALAALRAERDKYHDALIARHGGEPIALLAELDEARAERDAALAREATLRLELQYIATADPRKWDEEARDQFQAWAQNRARAALAAKEFDTSLAQPSPAQASAKPPAVPEGWVLVPRVPTPEMHRAALDSDGTVFTTYVAMINAAPTPGE